MSVVGHLLGNVMNTSGSETVTITGQEALTGTMVVVQMRTGEGIGQLYMAEIAVNCQGRP